MGSRRTLLLLSLVAAGSACGLLPNIGGGPGGGNPLCGTDEALCAAKAFTCGEAQVVDSCGATRTVTCGTCTAPQSCGGGGVANQCGASCAGGCPTGFTCSPFGVCVGGSATGLVLDVKTVPVSGTITLNGAVPPTLTYCQQSPTSTKATLSFYDLATGSQVSVAVPCSAQDYAFSAALPPGRYRVSVSGYSADRTSLPTGGFVVDLAREISGPIGGLTLDVRTTPVSGRVTLNGLTPGTLTYCAQSPTSTKATVSFVETTTGTAVSTSIPCSAQDYAFSTLLGPGTWRAMVSGYSADRTNLPTGSFGIAGTVTVDAARSDVVLDVKTVPVSGRLTMNGVVPATLTYCTQSPTSTKATLSFLEASTGTSVSASIPCSAQDYAFTALLTPGTWRVTVSGYSADRTNLPTGTLGVTTGLAISGSVVGLVLDVATVPVSGAVQLNEQVPGTLAYCQQSPTSTKATVTFHDGEHGTSVSATVPCSAAGYEFATLLPPGTYRAAVSGYSADRTPLPTGTVVVATPVTVSGSTTGLVLDVQTLALSGKLTHNGVVPATLTYCAQSPTSTKATVSFVEATAPITTSFLEMLRAPPATRVSMTIPCSAADYAFSGLVPPGTYRVTVSGYSADRTPLPTGTVGVVQRLEVR